MKFIYIIRKLYEEIVVIRKLVSDIGFLGEGSSVEKLRKAKKIYLEYLKIYGVMISISKEMMTTIRALEIHSGGLKEGMDGIMASGSIAMDTYKFQQVIKATEREL